MEIINIHEQQAEIMCALVGLVSILENSPEKTSLAVKEKPEDFRFRMPWHKNKRSIKMISILVYYKRMLSSNLKQAGSGVAGYEQPGNKPISEMRRIPTAVKIIHL